jgi:hypothetical protein
MTTLAPLTTAPVGSLTVPTMLPEPTVVCAEVVAANANMNNASVIEQIDRLSPLPLASLVQNLVVINFSSAPAAR